MRIQRRNFGKKGISNQVTGKSPRKKKRDPTKKRKCLYDSDLVGDVEGVVVGSQPDVGLLHAIGADQGVHFTNVDLVQLFDSLANLRLVGLQIDDENQSVVVFNLLHGRFCRQGIPDDGIGIHTISAGRALLGKLGRSLQSQRLGATEFDSRPHLLDASAKAAFDDLLLSRERLGGRGRLGDFLFRFDPLDGLGVLLRLLRRLWLVGLFDFLLRATGGFLLSFLGWSHDLFLVLSLTTFNTKYFK